MIGKLRKGLDELKLPVNLIPVSDHGMQDVNAGFVSLDSIADSNVRVVSDGPVALIYCRNAIASPSTAFRGRFQGQSRTIGPAAEKSRRL
jgi:hypothetical protein